MNVTVVYRAQARRAARVAAETVRLSEGATVERLLSELGDRHGEPLRGMLCGAPGAAPPSLLLFVGDEQVRADSARALNDGDRVFVLTPIAGG